MGHTRARRKQNIFHSKLPTWGVRLPLSNTRKQTVKLTLNFTAKL